MTITLNLPQKIIDRAQEVAEANDMDMDTLVIEALADYLEEEEDLAEARDLSRRRRSGEIKGISLAEVRARIPAQLKFTGWTSGKE